MLNLESTTNPRKQNFFRLLLLLLLGISTPTLHVGHASFTFFEHVGKLSLSLSRSYKHTLSLSTLAHSLASRSGGRHGVNEFST